MPDIRRQFIDMVRVPGFVFAYAASSGDGGELPKEQNATSQQYDPHCHVCLPREVRRFHFIEPMKAYPFAPKCQPSRPPLMELVDHKSMRMSALLFAVQMRMVGG